VGAVDVGLAARLELVDQLGGDNHAVSIVIQRIRRGGADYPGRQTVVAGVKAGGRPKFT
jgi:hypothetical protein